MIRKRLENRFLRRRILGQGLKKIHLGRVKAAPARVLDPAAFRPIHGSYASSDSDHSSAW